MTNRKYRRGMAGGAGLGANPQFITGTIGSGLLATAPFTGPAAPFVAAAGVLTTLIGSFFKPDLTKIQATAIVNQIEGVLKENLLTWQALRPEQKTVSAQAAALSNFDAGWAAVLQGCSNPQLGHAGQVCITDRQRGGRWPWEVYYRDPIANDAGVVPDPSILDSITGSGGGAGTASGISGIPAPLLWATLLVGVAMVFSGGKNS